MTTPLPLAVRMVTSRADRHVTRQLRDLVFRETAVGGWASIALRLDRPLTIQPDEIDYYSRVYVYDRRTGRTVSEGRLEDPGRSADVDGQIYDLVALGPSARAQDRSIPYIPVDRRLDVWVVGGAAASANYIRIDQRGDEDSTAVIQMQAPTGCTFGVGAAGLVVNQEMAHAGLQLGRVSMGWRSGFTSSNNEARLGTAPGNGSTVAVETDLLSVSTGTLTGSRGGANPITAGHDSVRVRFTRINSSLAGADNIWLEFTNPVTRMLLKTKTGTDITSGYSADTVLASEVVADLLGRVLDSYDGANATIDTTSYGIEQLAYPDCVHSSKVLDDLMVLEPAYRWGAYESNAAGKHRFEWVAWPTTVRYEADVRDGVYTPGSADGLYNAVNVRWRDAYGQINVARRTASVSALTAAGLTREAAIDLGDEMGSLNNAQRAGDQFLAEHAYPANSGTLTVARSIKDLYTGRRVRPWEIKAGELIRVRGILPRVDSLNATARDGSTVFRIWSKEYSTANAAARLELDSYSQTTARALATLQSKPNVRRR